MKLLLPNIQEIKIYAQVFISIYFSTTKKNEIHFTFLMLFLI